MRKLRNQQLQNRSELDVVVCLIIGNYGGELTWYRTLNWNWISTFSYRVRKAWLVRVTSRVNNSAKYHYRSYCIWKFYVINWGIRPADLLRIAVRKQSIHLRPSVTAANRTDDVWTAGGGSQRAIFGAFRTINRCSCMERYRMTHDKAWTPVYYSGSTGVHGQGSVGESVRLRWDIMNELH